MTVEELMNRMSSREFSEWMAFYRLEPFGSEIELFGHGITASTVYNVNRGKNKKALDPSDFVPNFEEEARPKTMTELIAHVERMNKMFGGTDER